MKRAEDTSGQEKRYIGLDVHKHYITVGGMNVRQEMALRLRNVEMERFKRWAEENLRKTDEVVLETTTNTWDIYDTIAPLVERVVVANPAEVKQIANARVKTDNQDVVRLLRLLIAGMIPEVWVPPVDVRELRALSKNGDGNPEPHAQSFTSPQSASPGRKNRYRPKPRMVGASAVEWLGKATIEPGIENTAVGP